MNKKDVYFLNTHTKNKLGQGYKLVVNEKYPHSSDVDDDIDEAVLQNVVDLETEDVYEIGFGMGKLLLSLRRLLPNAKVGGCDGQDLNRSFGNNHFSLAENNIHLDVVEVPYKEIGIHDVIVIVDATEELLNYAVDRCDVMVLTCRVDETLVKEDHIISEQLVGDKKVVVVKSQITLEVIEPVTECVENPKVVKIEKKPKFSFSKKDKHGNSDKETK